MSTCLKCGAELPPRGDCPACAGSVAESTPSLLRQELTHGRPAASPGRAVPSFADLQRPSAPPPLPSAGDDEPWEEKPTSLMSVAAQAQYIRASAHPQASAAGAAPPPLPSVAPAVAPARKPAPPPLPSADVVPWAQESAEARTPARDLAPFAAPAATPRRTPPPALPNLGLGTPPPRLTPAAFAPSPSDVSPAAPQGSWPGNSPPGASEVHARPAALWRKLVAWSIDATAVLGFIALFLFVGSLFLDGPPPPTDMGALDAAMAQLHALSPLLLPAAILLGVATLAYTAVFGFLWQGRTPGRFVAGVRLVDASGLPPSRARAIFRAVLSAFSFALCMGGFWLALFDRRGQTLHDKLTSTFVVRPGES